MLLAYNLLCAALCGQGGGGGGGYKAYLYVPKLQRTTSKLDNNIYKYHIRGSFGERFDLAILHLVS